VHTNVHGVSATGDWAGTATNGYKTFQCYKDNGRQIYPISSGGCNSEYYCLVSILSKFPQMMRILTVYNISPEHDRKEFESLTGKSRGKIITPLRAWAL